MDLLVLSGGRLFQLLSKGDGTFAQKELELPGFAVQVETVDLNGDGIDDARVTLRGGEQYLLYGHAGQGGDGGLHPSDPTQR
jgi:hypothetical protein